MSRTTTTDVIVLGLGAFGSATLYQLATRGVRTIGIDRFVPPHDHGSSHGATRITRVGVGEGEDYVPLVRRSHEIWRELESATGRDLFDACGALVFSGSGAAGTHHGQPRFVDRSIAAARRFGIDHRVLDAAEIGERFPQFGLDGTEVGYFEPGGGFLRPEACIAAQLDRARALGAHVRTGETLLTVKASGTGVVVETDRGRIEASQAIACLGPWTGAQIGGPFASLLSVNRQSLYWFAVDEPAAYAPSRFPVYIWMHGVRETDYFYGFPMADDHGGIKVATEQYEVAADPDAGHASDDSVGRDAVAAMYDVHLHRRLRGIRRDCTHAARCFYTVTPDRSFIVDRHPDIDGLTVVSACSGHGFKHSAGMGEALAEHALRGRDDRLAPFALGRFNTTRAPVA